MSRRRLLGWWPPVRRAARAVLDKIPFTVLSLLLLGAAAVAVLHYGRERQDLVLYVTGLAVAGLVVLAELVVTLAAVLLWLAWRRPRARPAAGKDDPVERIEAESLAPSGFSLPSLGWLPLLSIRWEWREPAGVKVEAALERGRLVEKVWHAERGEYRRVVRRLVIEDVFGLARLALRLVEERTRKVLPARGRPLSTPIVDAMAGGDNVSHPSGPPDGDLVEMRRYAPGDPMKRILWKTYARTRALMVRLPERAYTPTRKTLAFLVAGEGDEAAAGVARMALESGAFGPDWRFSADGCEETARTVHDAVDLIVRSHGARERQGQGLEAFLERSANIGVYRCVLFVPPQGGAWIAPILDQVKRRAGRVEVIVGTDGVRGGERRGRWRRFLYLPEDPEAETRLAEPRELETVVARLGAAGARVQIIDRRSGRWHGRSAVRRTA